MDKMIVSQNLVFTMTIYSIILN